MLKSFCKNKTVHISDRSHLNLTLNILKCGNTDISGDDQANFKNTDVFTMIYVNEGQATVVWSSSEYRISAGQGLFLFTNMDTIIKNKSGETLNMTWVDFTGYLIDNYLGRANITQGRPLFQDKEGKIGEGINRLYMYSHKMPNRYCKMASALYNVFACLLDENPTKSTLDYNKNAEFYTVKAIDYIERNYTRDISVDEVAQIIGITRKHLYRVFRYVLDTSPKRYIICLRIEKAAKQLRYTNQSIAEIAEIVGYQNQFYFSKEFKRLTGLSPSQYRASPVDIKLSDYA